MNGRLILEGVVGAYGLATPQSDIDRLAVYQAPTEAILGLHPVQETHVVKDELGDMTTHEVSKFIKLCLACNPTVMELLWLDSYLTIHPWGRLLRNARTEFLSAKALDSYMGYAFQQATRLVKRGDFDPDLRKRTQKHGRHCWRLLIQGEYLVETGVLRVQLTPDQVDECRSAGEDAEQDPQTFFVEVKTRCDRLKANGRGLLPEHPNIDAVNEVLLRIRRNQ